MRVRLEVSHSKANVKRVVLTRNTTIGRAPECNLRIAAGQVSRKHCEILVGEAGVLVRDLGSSNGTFVAGSRIPPYEDVPIPPGTSLTIGGVCFQVKYELSDSRTVGGGSTVHGSSSKAPAGGEKPAPEVMATVDASAAEPSVQEPTDEDLPALDHGFDDGFERPADEEVTLNTTMAEIAPSFESDDEVEVVEEEPAAADSSNEDAVFELVEEEDDEPAGESGKLADFLRKLD